jgi:hypothetical protein
MWMSKLDSRRGVDPLRAGVAVDPLLEELREGLRHIEVARRTQSEPTAARARARAQAALRFVRDHLESAPPTASTAPYARAVRGAEELERALKAFDETRPAVHM